MTITQASHQLPTKFMHPPLVTSGANKSITQIVGKDFCFRADDDGEITEIDEKHQIVMVKYKDGSVGCVDISNRSTRAPDGFYVSLQLQLSDGLKVGSKFKKNDILAADRNFFNVNGIDTQLYQGTIAKIALAPLHNTYEDSSVITESFSNLLSAEIVMETSIALSPKTNIESIAKIGDKIKTSDALAVFEEVFDDETGDISALLSKLGEEFEEQISAYGKNSKLSKYTGEVIDIRIHYNREISEYSESIQKLIKSYIKMHKDRGEKLDTVRPDQIVDMRKTDIDEFARAGAIKYDGIYIQFFIKTIDEMSVGDKLSLSVALKNIVAETIPSDKAPYSSNTRGNVDMIVTPMSVVSRMTQDFFLQMWANKALIELKNEVLDIWSE